MADQSSSARFVEFISSAHGEAGRAWLAALPNLLEYLSDYWQLRLGQPYGLSINYVAPAVRADGSHVVLKVGYPHPELDSEREALRYCDGHGLVRLIDALPERGALLLDRLEPGVTLAEIHGTPQDDELATRIAARVMRQIWRPVPEPNPFHKLERWTAGLSRIRPFYGGSTGPFPERLVDKAQSLLRELMTSPGEQVLLHGDLQHYNILKCGENDWRVIDPKGLVGEREFDIGPFVYNPFGLETWPDLRSVLARRLSVLAEELDFDLQRITRWAFVEEVLSQWWSVEDHGPSPDPSSDLILMETLSTLL